LCLSLAGCSGATFPPYSADIQYRPRTDPVFAPGKVPPNENVPTIDRVGVLPVAQVKDFDDPGSPYLGSEEQKFLKENLGTNIKDPTRMDSATRVALDKALKAWFGTPAKPKVDYRGLDVDAAKADGLELRETDLAKGSALYRVHCLHCHGVAGDGRGTTAKWVNPHPRDYRQMLFKFTSVKQPAGVASRKDLYRVVEQGLDGTSMPAFVLLRPEEINLMVSYVMHLTLRGYVEYKAINQMAMEGGKLVVPQDLLEDGANAEERLINTWKVHFAGGLNQMIEANEPERETKPVPYTLKFFPQSGELHDYLTLLAKKERTADEQAKLKEGEKDFEEFKSSVQKGYVHFMEKDRGNCRNCHINFGRDSKYRFDLWGTLVRPRDLTLGQYRGGRRAHDLYYRVALGITPSGMPAAEYFEKNPAAIWDTLNFVQLLPLLVKPEMQQLYGVNLQEYKELKQEEKKAAE
jgi:mono/diheme cytochrome c family protein